MMSEESAQRLRERHEQVVAAGRRTEVITVTHLGREFVVPPEVYAPSPLGLAELVLHEVRDADRVLDMGTGSGVNGIIAAAKSRDVVAVDVNPIAVECAKQNAEMNGVAARLDIRESDLFENVPGRFDLIIFDPPFRWFRPQDLYERGMADENYESLTQFFFQVKGYLVRGGRILLAFGTTGDIGYLRHLISQAGFDAEELRRAGGEADGYSIAFRLKEAVGGIQT